jgi:hypothetical protein
LRFKHVAGYCDEHRATRTRLQADRDTHSYVPGYVRPLKCSDCRPTGTCGSMNDARRLEGSAVVTERTACG